MCASGEGIRGPRPLARTRTRGAGSLEAGRARICLFVPYDAQNALRAFDSLRVYGLVLGLPLGSRPDD